MTTGKGPNRVAMDEAIGVFLAKIVPYMVSEIETAASQPIESAALEVFGREVGNQFLTDLGIGQSGALRRQPALNRISLTVEFFWPIFKQRMRNRKVSTGALRQIEYAGVSAADRGVDLEPLYVEQRMADIIDILGRIQADSAREEVEILQKPFKST